MELFNRSLLATRRARHRENFAQVGFLKHEIAERLAERLRDINRKFPVLCDLDAHTSFVAETLPSGKAGTIISGQKDCQLDEELIPFADQSLDAIMSNFSLHWVNDLLGTLIQCRRALKPDGLFLAAIPAPQTLRELRQAMQHVANESGKTFARIAPFPEIRDIGNLLQRAGFSLPVIDSEMIHLTYRDFSTLLREIQMMGESNVLKEQFKGLTTARYWNAVEAAYPRESGLYPVTVEVSFLSAWAPHSSQQKPAKRGSGTVSLKDVLQSDT